MPALQSLDATVFRFINGTLANPFCDWLMPILSGGAWFLPLLFVAGAWWIWKGGTQARLCALMLALVVPIGDGWVTKTIKKAVQRPRPCRTLENVNLPMRLENPRPDDDNEFHRGCTGTGSMPSGHTTNWFSATMVAWIFYRRSWRFMLPLACAVAFSRVYNGVHYPADILAGAVIGAGYGLALSLGLNEFWKRVLCPCFPIWCRNLPSLLPSRPTPHAPHLSAPPDLATHWLRLGWWLIGVVFLGRLWYIASGRIELSEDEAYQWIWSKHLALSYFSKPPLIAYTQWLGTHLFGDTELGVRFFSPVCAAIVSLAGLRFFAKHVNARAGFWLVAVCNVTPLLGVGSTLMTVDPLLVLFWTLAMFAGWRAVQSDGAARHWALVGLWMGLGFLSKYTALLQWLCWAVFFLVWKPARVHLRRPGPYVALAINAVCMLPVLIWNAQHGWITLEHVGGNAKLSSGWAFHWRHPLEFLGGTFGLLHPAFFVASAWACVALWKRTREPLPRYFFAMGAPLFLVYALYTLHSRVQLNWIAASIIPLFCLMVLFWERRYAEGLHRLRGLLTGAMIVGVIAVALLHETSLVKSLTGFRLPVRSDPLNRVRGWSEMARIVDQQRAVLAAEGRPVFVLTGHYGNTALLTFYSPEARTNVTATPLVYHRHTPRPKNQFHFWPGYFGTRRGQNAIYARDTSEGGPPPADVVRQFASVTEIGTFPVTRRGRVLRSVQLFACRDLQR